MAIDEEERSLRRRIEYFLYEQDHSKSLTRRREVTAVLNFLTKEYRQLTGRHYVAEKERDPMGSA